MSSKNTPNTARTNKLNNINNNVVNNQTPDSVRKRVLSCKQKSNVENFLHKKIEGDIDLNTAFSVGSTIMSKRATTPISKLKSKSSTALNACYTPSSLYRSANLTPTPVYKSLISSSKLSGTPKDRNYNKKFDSKVGDSTPECFSKVKFDSDRKGSSKILEDVKSTHKDGEASNLKVAVRIRPLNTQECLNTTVTNCVSVDGEEIIINGNLSSDSAFGTKHSFFYDHVFWSCNSEDPHYADQNSVFKGTGLPLIERAFEGYNACLFAYGQTGSGKSYSMMGIEEGDTDDISSNPDMGIIPRFCNELFNRINLEKYKIEAEVEISYFEIYNEKIHDLLSVASTKSVDGVTGNCTQQKNALKVREHPVWGPYVVDLSTHPVDSYLGLRNWLALGNSQRATAATGMNDKSSRSHSIFNIILNLTEVEKMDNKTEIKQTRRSKISLVDLAGSERISHKSASGERVREGVSINKSLLTLGKVIAALADFKKGVFVPYRESVLTWLLRESLGGNSKTVMLATISPASIHLDETLATLRYACQARTIVNRVKVNEDPHDKIIRELRAEVERLQALRQDYERQKRYSTNDNLGPRKIIIETSVDESEVEALRQQLAETEKELTKAQKSWMERLKEAEDLRKNEIRMLKRKGLAMELSIEHKQACLVNLAADPILSGTLLYILPPGKVLIGRSRPTAFSQPDIVLEGPLVAFQHCSIQNDNGKLYIIPENKEFETYLNGELVTDAKQMFHGDRLVIGGSHYFRISNPNCVNKHKNVVVDYQLAHQEILQKQEEQLRKELEEEKKIALDEIEKERLANEKIYSDKMEMLELEKFKFKCTKELLESEQKALEEKIQDEKFEYTPFKSTLLDDIKRIMERPTDENLHQIQLKVKEATQRCRDLGLKYDFKQTQVVDEFGIFRAVVSIYDKDNLRKAEWPTARLDVWLDIMRENENPNSENIFESVDVEWVDLSRNIDESINDSLNSSRISLNLSAVKDVILQEPKMNNKSLKESNKANLNKTAVMNSSFSTIENIRKALFYDDEDTKRSPDINENKKFSSPAFFHLLDIQKSTLKLKKLCEQTESDENYDDKKHTLEHFKKSIEKMENIIFDLKATLTEQKLSSPTKTPKSVRFLLD